MGMRQYWLLAAAGCVIAACGSSMPESPSAPSGRTTFGGSWVASIGIETCSGSHACIALDTSWFVLRLAQNGSEVHGVAYVAGNAVDVTGTVDPAGQLTLTTPPRPFFTLHELSLRADPTFGMTGTIHFTASSVTLRGHIASVKHGPLEPTQTTVQGTWVGSSLVRSCTYTGYRECPSLQRLFRLSMTQTGSLVSGNLEFDAQERFGVPVRGTFTSSVLTLDGAVARPTALGGVYQLRLLTWTSRSDAFGRMTGSFTYEEQLDQGEPRLSARYESDLVDVALLPDPLPTGNVTGRSGARQSPRFNGVPAPLTDGSRLVQTMTTIMPVRPSLREDVRQ